MSSGRRALHLVWIVSLGSAVGAQDFQLPELPPPHLYGTIFIDRTASAHDVAPVRFDHWTHRQLYACRVCHLELGFAMARNETPISEKRNAEGRFCGACHDGVTAFASGEGSCERCHTREPKETKSGFKRATRKLPEAAFGDGIDWTRAMQDGDIHPVWTLEDEPARKLEFYKLIVLRTRWTGIAPAIFPHAAHIRWLDCANCHPDLFDIKQGSTDGLTMKRIISGDFCGVCHRTVAFPLDDCTRCHPRMMPR